MNKHLRGIGLRIGVDEQDFVAFEGQPGGEVDGGRRFGNAAFLVHNGNDHKLIFGS